MAGMGIPKTIYTLNIFNCQLQGDHPPNRLYSANISARKQFVPFFINKFRIIALIDTGADMSCMHDTLLRKLIPENKWNLEKANLMISASGDTMSTLGNITLQIQFSKYAPSFTTTICIVPEIENTPSFIVGMNTLQDGKGEIKTLGEQGKPELTFHHPISYTCPVHYFSPAEQETCRANYDLKPFESATVMFTLNKAAPVVRTDIILITASTLNTINILPSRVDLEFDVVRDCYTASAYISNLTNKHVKGSVWGRFEILKSHSVFPIEKGKFASLKQALRDHPLGREILYSRVKDDVQVPLLTISKVSVKQEIFHAPDERIIDINPADTILRGEPTYSGEIEIDQDMIDPKGIELPTQVFANAAEAVDLSKYNEELRPFIKDIFIDKYPEVVALHSIDAGDLSLTLGLTQIRLKPGELLPRCKRIFHMSPTDTRHLHDICELLIKFGYLIKTPMEPDGTHLYGMASYLVTRAKPGTLGRLVVDYSPINSLIQSPPNIIPDINNTLQFLSGKALYTSLDLKQAYLSLKVDEQSRILSTFITPTGSYRWTCIPTGMANSPAYWSDASQRMIHSEPVLDKENKPVYECKNLVKLKPSPLPWVRHYFDDILSTSPLRKTFHETLKLHFEILEQLIKRLAFHGSKISIGKSDFAKGKICFLGWYVSNGFVIADPRRIQKIKDFIFPESKKGMRSFLGLVNSLRRVTHLKILEDAHILTPLTSSTQPYKPTEEHKRVFEKVKEALISEPLFNNLVDEKAPKYLWVDAATGSGVVGAVLAQKRKGIPDEKIVPTCLDLDDPVHRIIYDKELTYEPVKVYEDLPICLPKPSLPKTVPPDINPKKKFLAFDDLNVHDSFFLGVAAILAVYNCKPVQSTRDLRELAVKELKKGVLALKLRDFVFDNNFGAYREFLDEFKRGKHNIDKHFFLIDALATALYRPIILISALAQHRENPIIKFNYESTKPPLIFGVYEIEGEVVFMPFFHNRNVHFVLDDLFQKIEIIAYSSKTVPENMSQAGIVDQELLATLEALSGFNRYITESKVTLLTDSKCLYYLFHSKIQNSCVKTKRWCDKLYTTYPGLILQFVKTTDNLSDFLTREGLPKGDLIKYDLKSAVVLDFYDDLPKTNFTLKEWVKFCEQHPEYLTINEKEPKQKTYSKTAKSVKNSKEVQNLIMSIRQGIENIKDIVTPLDIIKERISRSEIVKNQKKEFSNIYTECLAGKDFEFIDEKSSKKFKYKLISDLLMIYDNFYKILLPPSMIGLLLSFTHLLGHKGILRMLADLESYYFENKYSITKRFIKCCYACFLSHKSSRRSKLGVYPIPSRPMEEVAVDLVECLNKVNGYSHLMITKCALSNFTLIHPLETKSAKEVSRLFMHAVLIPFDVKKVHQDNGKAFRAHDWLELMSLFDVTIINTSAINPEARGFVERTVGLVKLMMKKYLATASSGTLYWDMINYAVNKVMNYSIDPSLKLIPAQMVFGTDTNGPAFLRNEPMAQPHYSVKNNKVRLEQMSKEINEMVQYANEQWTLMKTETNERLNKNRITKRWVPNDIVFVLDRLQIPGNTRPLKLKFNPSPYVVIRCLFSTSLLRRLSDGFIALYANDHLKKYDGADPIFATLPPEINKILLNKFQDFLTDDFTQIAKFDTFDIQTGIQLYDPDNDQFQQEQPSETNLNDQDAIINKINLRDEFYDDDKEPFDNDRTQEVPTKLDFPKRSLIEDDIQNLTKDDIQNEPSNLQNAEDFPQENDTEIEEEDNDELAERNLRKFRKRTVRFEAEPIQTRSSKRKAAETSTYKTGCINSIFHNFQEFD